MRASARQGFCVGLVLAGMTFAGASFGGELKLPVLARSEGDTQILVPPAAGVKTNLISVEGKTYAVVPTALGQEVPKGAMIKTGTTGKARLVYPSGDYLSVSPNSMFRILAREMKSESMFELLSGKVRALIIKRDPKDEDVTMRSRTAVMGVRGTDFHVAAWSEEGGSQVTVFRGKVAVATRPPEPVAPVAAGAGAAKAVVPPPMPDLKLALAKAVEVGAGSTATLAAPPPPPPTPVATNGQVTAAKVAPPPPPPPMPMIRQTTKEELVVIQKETTVAKAVVAQEVAKDPLAAERQKKLEELEASAAKAAVTDIKTYDPALYKAMESSGKPIVDADAVQTITVKKIFQTAPNAEGNVAPEARKAVPKKPSLKDLDSAGDVYQKYQ